MRLGRMRHILVIRKGISRHATFKDRSRIRVFSRRTKVEYPILVSVSGIEEPLDVVSWIAVVPLKTLGRISHYNNLLIYIRMNRFTK